MHSSQRKLGLPVGKHEGIVPRDFERVLWLVKDKIVNYAVNFSTLFAEYDNK